MTEPTAILPWHVAHWQRLIARQRGDSLPHALLLTGPVGIGKGQFAGQLAQALLCQSPLPDGRACGACRTCRLYQAGSHPDFARVSPDEGSKVIKIGQIRDLIARLGMTSQLGGYRVALISPAHRLNTEAANSLLKTLEEPGPRSLLLLLSDRPGMLPATIRSRCQTLSFAPPPREIGAAWLRERAEGLDPELLLGLAGGAPLAALALADPERLARRGALIGDLLEVAAGEADPVAMARRWHGEDLVESVGWLTRTVMDLIRLKLAAQPPNLANPDLRPRLQPLAERVDLSELYGHLQRLQQAVRLGNTQVSAQSILEDVLIPWRNGVNGR
jgi:DNA polymerase-3 subunit delta'